MHFLKEILKEKCVNEEEQREISKNISTVIKAIVQNCKKKNIKASVVLGGSAAKGTFIKGDFDVDIFVRFDQKYKNKNLSDILEDIIKPFKPTKIHGSRDYFQFTAHNISYEIIPVLYVEKPEEAQNVTDMSPLHVLWVQKHLTEQLKEEIILAKLFCKAQKVYGAESHIKGFSGHVLDILVVYYGSFLNLLEAAKDWKFHEFIDIEDYKTELNKDKISPLIVIDPVQPERNACAALSEEKFLQFKKASEEFLKSPSKKFFIKKSLNIDNVKKQYPNDNIVLFTIIPLKGKEDITGSKIIKVLAYISRNLTSSDFIVLDDNWEFEKDKTIAYIVVEKEELSEKKEHMGPPLERKKDCKMFREKHKETIIKDNRLYALIKRDYRRIEDAVKKLLKDEYVKERVKEIKWVKK